MSICFGILVCQANAQAATPRLMVSDYSIKEEKVVAGKEFTLTLTLKNTASKAVKNVKVSLTSEAGELLPAEGAGTAYVSQIDADSEEKVTFHMVAASGLQEKSYKLSIKTEYESSGGMGYTVDESVFIPVSLKQRISVTDIFVAEDNIELGDTVEISASINNLGEGTLYNVSARIKGDNIKETSTYVGNIESGKSGSVDALTKAAVVTEGNHVKNYLVISYEDKAGNVYSEEMEFEVMVIQPVYKDLEKVKEGKDYSALIKKIVKIVVVIVAIALIVVFFIRKKKKKQQMLEEFMQ